MPGVSTNTICEPGRVRIPRIRWRVVCGLGATMLILVPSNALRSVDLPTFGRPTRAANPHRWCVGNAVSLMALDPHSQRRWPPITARRHVARRHGGSVRCRIHAVRVPPLRTERRTSAGGSRPSLDRYDIRAIATRALEDTPAGASWDL